MQSSCNIPFSGNDDVTKVYGKNALTDYSVFTHNRVRVLNFESNFKNKSLFEDGIQYHSRKSVNVELTLQLELFDSIEIGKRYA